MSNLAKEIIVVLYTAQMALMLSSLISAASSHEVNSGYDILSEAVSYSILGTYFLFICIVLPYIFWSIRQLPENESIDKWLP